MTIRMLDWKEHKPEKSGTYLLKTETTGPLKRIQFLQASIIVSEKGKISADINNQIVLSFSNTPIL